MANYIFENMSDSDAAAFGANDYLIFSSNTANATNVKVAPYTGSGSSLGATGITLTSGGTSHTFNSNLSAASTADHILFTDGSNLIIGTSGADATLGATGATAQQVIYGLDGADGINLSSHADFVYGGTGNDTIGSATSNGNYHIYGDSTTGTALAAGGTTTDNDTIIVGSGSSYIQGNEGTDTITVGVNAAGATAASTGGNTVFGGADNDTITVQGAGSNHVNGNKGFDTINASTATGYNISSFDNGVENYGLRGGAGNDIIRGGLHDTISGDAGQDDLYAGTATGHISVLTGGADADNFHFTTYNATIGAGGVTTYATGSGNAQGTGTTAGAVGYFNEVKDFTAGTDHIDLGFAVNAGSSTPSGSTFTTTAGILLQDTGVTFSNESAAATYAQQLLTSANHTGDVAALQVGSDTFLFYNSAQTSNTIDSVIKLDNVQATNLTQTAAGGTGVHDFTAASITHI